ncbi:MAG: ankyrin repeat domain-containing protein [Sumerlaeia bacterium]
MSPNLAFLSAADSGDIGGLRAALASGAALEFRSRQNLTALMKAAARGHLLVVEYLLDHGADPAALTSHGLTALHFAIQAQHRDTAACLIRRGAPLQATRSMSAPLLWASQRATDQAGCFDIVEMLLNAGADPNAADQHLGNRPLHHAALRDDLALARLLLRHGADPAAVNYQQESPRYTAHRHQASLALRRLLGPRETG